MLCARSPGFVEQWQGPRYSYAVRSAPFQVSRAGRSGQTDDRLDAALVVSGLTPYLVGSDLRFGGRPELVVGGVERDQGFFVGLANLLELVDVTPSIGKVNLRDLQSGSVRGSEPAIG